jgi:diguanylate cyclase (GGDEF)-like protein/PAS domain S-box-containing protein
MENAYHAAAAAAIPPGIALKQFLSRLIWICIAPLLLLASYLAFFHVRYLQDERDLTARHLATNFVTTLDQVLLSRIHGLGMLARSPGVDDPALRGALLQEALRFKHSFGNDVILADAGMQMLFNTRVPTQTQLPLLPRPQGHSAVATALQTGQPAVGDIVIGPVAHRALIAIAVPVLRQSKATSVVLTTMDTDYFQTYLEHTALPDGWVLRVLDGQGAVIAQQAHKAADLQAQEAGAVRLAVPSQVAPWSVQVEIPQAIFLAPMLAAGLTLAAALLAATLASYWGGSLAADRLNASMQSLAMAAGAPVPQTVVREIEAVRGLLQSAAQLGDTARAALQESQQRLQLFIRHAPVAIAMFDQNMRYLAASQRWVSEYALDAGDLIGRSQFDVLPAMAQQFQPVCERGTAGEIVRVDEARMERPDGTVRWLCWEARPWLAVDGSVGGIAVFSEDITSRKQTETDLRIAAAAFESQEAMMVTDARSVILKVNRAFTESTGYAAEEVVGKTPHILQSGRHNADFYKAMWVAVGSDGCWQGEVWDRRKTGEEYQKWLNISAVTNDAGQVTHYVGTHFDITERKRAEETIKELAFYDTLTHLPNRTLLHDRLQQAMTASHRNAAHGALLFIDLDHFKKLNDTLGHDTGDLLLQQVAQRLSDCVREGDTVARLGGDEFVVVLENLSSLTPEAATQTESIGAKILHALNQKHHLATLYYRISCSIGATLFSGHGASIDDLLKQADLAMYRAKDSGRNALRFFDPEMQSVVMARATLESDLSEAIQAQQFLLYYQPQIAQGQVTGSEALLRWLHPTRGMVSPAEFIALAEETGLILPLGSWVMNAACRQLAQWASNPELAGLTLSVNVSVQQFRQQDFVEQVLWALTGCGANPQRLKLELTESLLVQDVQDIVEKMVALKARGVGFSLDDFGTGYSSLAYLKLLPLDQLKIDQSFVRDVLIDPNDAAIAKTIVGLAHSLGFGVIAEGVETEAQRDFLASVGCHAYQGYFYSRPIPVSEFEAYAVSRA